LRRYNRWYVYVLLIASAGVLADCVWTPCLKLALGSARTYRMPSKTMEPTLRIGDHFVVRMDYYTRNKPKESDIVVFRYPEDHSKDFVKRVVALEGQKLEIRNKRVLVNDEKIEEPWAIYSMSEVFPVNLSPRDNLGPITIPTGHVFVMGDNRDFSLDSRFWGPLDIREIWGKALYIYWADDKQRIGNALQ
jgi:signal peptidase I